MALVDGVTRRRERRRQLPEEVAAHVRQQILAGRLRAGDFLRTEPIAEAVGVSTTPVREGLLTLRSEGFVRLVPRRGFVVAPFTRQDVLDLFWAQARLAGELAARAAKRITPERLRRLDAIVASHAEAARRGDGELVADLGHAFHREINLAADAPRLASLLASTVKHLPPHFYASLDAQVASTERWHPVLVVALRAGDARRARTLMEEHVQESAGFVVAMLERNGLWQDAERDS
ncbi:GntR family transcriptional regulator [Actinomadura harenae]|uniref:GntR family transcriptional regulator n=1 Tax=Actinomadura harenae TaxID=2483351 RepID=A0A3M2LNN1_9ACTN|nr:GntR family transcriptional regulator [Actinomadura harenae]RMI38153.1 GntR family transcriptional regulator [Actinomadura harenae]